MDRGRTSRRTFEELGIFLESWSNIEVEPTGYEWALTGPETGSYIRVPSSTGEALSYSRIDQTAQLLSVVLSRVDTLVKQVQALQQTLESRPLVTSLQICELESNQVAVKRPLSIVVEESEEDVLARWPETQAHGVAATMALAISDLKKDAVGLYLDLKSRDPGTLGDAAIRTLKYMDNYLELNE